MPRIECRIEARIAGLDTRLDDVLNARGQNLYAYCPFTGKKQTVITMGKEPYFHLIGKEEYLSRMEVDDNQHLFIIFEKEQLVPQNVLGQLNIPVPQILFEILGFTTEQHYLAIWWERAGDEVVVTDGRRTITGANWQTYLIYTGHPAVAPFLKPFNLGNSDLSATHALLWDKQDLKAYAGDKQLVQQVLREQWYSPDSPTIITVETFQAEAERLRDLMERRHEPVPPFDLYEARMSMKQTFDLQMQLRAELDTFIRSSPN
jgi:hypothetical protein